MTDNTTAKACINKQGSTQSVTCNAITRQIWEFVKSHDMWLSAAYCPGCENVEADEASQLFDDKTEWALRVDLFEALCSILGKPSIDLFASRLNNKCKRYSAWQHDPEAVFIDSLTQDWGIEDGIYAFPPFSIVHMVLQKIVQDEAEGIVIVPFWESQPWFTLLADLAYKIPIVIEVSSNELFLPFRQQIRDVNRHDHLPELHPMAGQLKLLAVYCNGRRWRDKVFLQELSKPCSIAGALHQTNFMRLTLTRQIWGIWKLRPAYSLETPNLGQNRWCFVPCDLEIWCMTLNNNRAPLLCYFKLYASFRSHRWIQAGVTVRKRPIWVIIDEFFSRVTLQFDVWPLNKANLRDLKAATGLLSGNAQFGSKSVMFCPVWPWNLMDDLGKQ